jgi:hypothetical protein
VNSLLFVKGLIGVMVFLSAAGAALLQLQARKVIPPIIKRPGPFLLKWHRWLGRIALAGTVLNSVICVLIGLYPALRSDPRHLAHMTLGALLMVVFLSKLYALRRKFKWANKRALAWGAAVLALQAGVFLTATVFAIYARIAGLA